MDQNLRDLIVGISMDVNSGPLQEMKKEIADLKKQIGSMEKPMKDTQTKFTKSHDAMISSSVALKRELSSQSDEMRKLARTSGVSIRHMADDWSTMSVEAKKALIDNHNNMIKYRKDIMNVETDMRKLGSQMGTYTGTTNEFMGEVEKMGKRHKKATEAMINNNVALRQSLIQQAGTMMNLSTTSSKINDVYKESGNALYALNRPFLAVTGHMEKMAMAGNASVLALKQLGPNASMKALQDRIRLINTGIMRQQMLMIGMGIAWIGFTAIVAKAAMGPDVSENLAAQAKAWDDYHARVKERTQEIYNTFSLFEEVTLKKTDPRRLYLNLEQQLKVMKDWQSNLSTLAGKGLDEAFIQELREMGPAAASEIAALTQMSDKGLNEYVAMWKEKHKLAKDSSITELQGLKLATQATVQELKDSLQPLGVAVEEFKNVWGVALKPFVEFWGEMAAHVVRAGTKVGEFVQRLNEISPWITKLGGMFLYLFTTFMVILSPLAIGIGLLGGMKASFAALFVVIKGFVVGFAAVAGTAILVSAAVIGLGAALYLLWTRNENFRSAVINTWEQIKSTAASVWGFIKPYIMQAIGAIVDFGRDKLAQLRKFWAENGAQILQAGKNIWNTVSGVVKTALNAIWEVMKFVWPYVLILIKSVWNNIKGVINGAIRVIMGVVKVFSGLFTGDFKKMWEGIKDIFFGAIQFVWNWIQLSFFGKMLGAGKAFILSFRSVLAAGWNFIKNLFTKSITTIKNFFVNGFNFLRTTADNIFNAITKGIFNFVTNAAKRFGGMVSEARRLFGMLRTFGANIFNALFQTLKNIVGKIVSNVRTGFATMRSRVSEIVTGIKTTVSTRFSEIVKAARELPGKIGKGIKAMAKFAMGGIKHLANMMVGGLAQGVNGIGSGINWVFEKLGIDTRVPKWEVPEYARGTNFHPGGPAIVGDGGGAELMRTRQGQVALSPSTPTLLNLPRGTEVLPHQQTRAMIQAPAYAEGTKPGLLGKAADAIKGAAGKVKDIGLDVFEHLGNPKDMLEKVYKKFMPKLPSVGGAFGTMMSGGLSFFKEKMLNFVKGKMPDMSSFIGGSGGPVPAIRGGVNAWRPMILRAAMQMREAITPREINGILAQIQRESGGNQSIIQSNAVWDVNTAAGNPARGLLQYIPQTFNRYKMPGNGNIYNGYDQLLAFFNNTNWRRDLPYGHRGWGPSGARKYGNGGIVTRAQMGIVGEAGAEAVIPLSMRKRNRGLNLLSKAASTMGVGLTHEGAPTTGGGSGGRTINYNPTINIQAGSDGTVSMSAKAEFKSMLDEHYKKIETLMLGEGGEI